MSITTNNKNIIASNHLQRSKKSISLKKQHDGNSQFVRSKLDTDYIPKIKVFKSILIKTQEEQRKLIEKAELQKQQNKIANLALQCIKRNERIEIDWKTKTNFRKSQMLPTKLPRIHTQPIQCTKERNSQQKLIHQSRFFRENLCESRITLSVREKSIQRKYSKLIDLISPPQTLKSYKNKSENHTNKHQIDVQKSSIPTRKVKQIGKIKKSLKSSKDKDQQLSNNSIHIIRVNSRYEGISEADHNQKQQNTDDDGDEFNFRKLRSNTGKISSLKNRHPNKDPKSQRGKSMKKSKKTKKSKKSFVTSDLDNRSSSIFSIQPQKPFNKFDHRDQQNYDILTDPQIISLISKTQEKIVNFKEDLIFQQLSQFQKFKFLDNKRNSVLEKKSQKNQLGLSSNITVPLKSIIESQTANKSLKQKLQQKKGRSIKLSQHVIKLLTQNESPQQLSKSKELSNSNLKPSQSIVDQLAERKWEQHQSCILRKKKESLIEAQQRILKKVRLTFLKEDLENKFLQIRNMRSPKSIF